MTFDINDGSWWWWCSCWGYGKRKTGCSKEAVDDGDDTDNVDVNDDGSVVINDGSDASSGDGMSKFDLDDDADGSGGNSNSNSSGDSGNGVFDTKSGD